MKFHRPVGAVRDMKELEYLVALHQTEHSDMEAWIDGSIDAHDIKSFLMSRYGIDVSKDEVRQVIFKGIGGGETEEDPCLDLLEIVSILVIPLLVKVANAGSGGEGKKTEEMLRLEPPPAIIADLLKNILNDTFGEGSSETPPRLTPELLKRILLEQGEFDVLQNEELVSKMIDAASGGDKEAVLDDKTFARALTDDVKLYDTKNETKLSTFLDDVFPEKSSTTPAGEEKALVADEENAKKTAAEVSGDGGVKMGTTLSQIDFVADNVLSWQHVVLVWLTVVFSYWLYMFEAGTNYAPCEGDSFGCTVANAVLLWLQVMIKLVLLGIVLGFSLSFGNSSRGKNVFEPILGLAAIAVFIFFPAFHSMSNFYFATNLDETHGPVIEGLKYIVVVAGVVLTAMQIKNLVGTFVKKESLPENLRQVFAGSNGRAEFRSKQAGIYKVNQMVKNAFDLHKENDESLKSIHEAKSIKAEDGKELLTTKKTKSEERSTRAIALENYAQLMDETEEIGGIGWSVKGFFTGSLQSTEGVWLSSRLLAASAIQVVATIVVFVLTVYFFGSFIEEMYGGSSVDYSESCFSTFDYSKCYFPFGGGYYTGVGICRNTKLLNEDCISLFEEVPLDTQFKQTCELLDVAYQQAVASVPGNLSCGTVFEWVEGTLELTNSTYPKELFTDCKLVSDADNGTIAAWMEADETFTEESVEYCRNMTNYIYDELSSGASEALGNLTETLGNLAVEAFDFCWDIFDGLNSTLPSMCDRKLYRSSEVITTYEMGFENETSFCSSVLSYCTPDPLEPATATCMIGQQNLIPFTFDGPTCRDYPEINNTLTFYDETVAPTINTVASLWPEKWMVVLAASFAIISGFVVAVATCFVYIPSSIHTVMKFRSGVIPSLRDPRFLGYRSGLDNMTYLIGAMFWGLVITSVLVSLLVGGVVFLLVWQVTRGFVTTIAAQVIGVLITVLVKMAVTKLFMRYSHAGFYRKKPMSANLFSIAMECWYLGLTLAFMLSRVAKFLVATSIYVGRIDRPVLSEGLILDLDSLPRVYRQNLLSTESHRHPYIELLGLIYLMKLRHKDDFGTSSGTAWRMLFVGALMPWLKKKRIQDALAEHLKNGGEDFPGAMAIGDEVIAGLFAINR